MAESGKYQVWVPRDYKKEAEIQANTVIKVNSGLAESRAGRAQDSRIPNIETRTQPFAQNVVRTADLLSKYARHATELREKADQQQIHLAELYGSALEQQRCSALLAQSFSYPYTQVLTEPTPEDIGTLMDPRVIALCLKETTDLIVRVTETLRLIRVNGAAAYSRLLEMNDAFAGPSVDNQTLVSVAQSSTMGSFTRMRSEIEQDSETYKALLEQAERVKI
jgi:hypothetical protein